MVDSHAHLDYEEYLLDFGKVKQDILEAGVNSVILPSVNIESFAKIKELVDEHKGFLYGSYGLHPTDLNDASLVADDLKKEMIVKIEVLGTENIVAIGEIGLDLYHSKEFLSLQKEMFIFQLELADKLNLPVIFHIRNAYNELFEVFEKMKPLKLKGVFHCYSGSYEEYLRIKKYGDFKIGIGGVLTFKNASLRDIVKKVDIRDIILETDAPFLSPVPFRGKPNTPAYLPYILKELSHLLEMDAKELEVILDANTEELFKLKSREELCRKF